MSSLRPALLLFVLSSHAIAGAPAIAVEAKGMTWAKVDHDRELGIDRISCHGKDRSCDAYQGDTLCHTELPVLCVNPQGKPRSWRIGEPFDAVASRFGNQLKMPMPFSASLLRLARITKSRRSPYDALMLQLHDCMKADVAYQSSVAQEAVDFPAGSTWMVFTDAVSHAAMAGQYQLEQTFLLPVDAMRQPAQSPLRILERIKGRPLA